MEYHRFKAPMAYCPTCSRKVDLLFPESGAATNESFYICFKCKTVSQLGVGELKATTGFAAFSDKERQAEVKASIAEIPDKYIYKTKGSQLRYDTNEATFNRRWLGLAEYEKNFGEALGYGKVDFREDSTTCKWCGKSLVAPRRSFCADKCSRAYGKVTYFKRGVSALPYRIACRDRFYCRGTGEDLAFTNRYGVRIPASNGQVEIHHLILVSEGGSDHEANLLTISAELHKAYHVGEPKALELINQIKAKQLELYHELMYTT
ncbi:HNH endonuclease [Carnobacterium gallinarum]|uniref:hypothetical protein n=1 Tax=Carnobacterium gallinarum TaxID=2749 RepID=UPI00055634E1|nr:hypothetical protein [Carnobacterium gallinarum]